MLENKFIFNDKMLKEYVIKLLCKGVIIWGNIIGILGLILSIFIDNSFNLGLNISASLICLFTAYATPYITIKSIKKQSKILHNGNKYETIITFNDKIYMNEGSYSNSFEYNQIKKIYKLKSCYVLALSKKPTQAIIIEPNSFINGTLEDFFNILKEKCINLKF